LLQPYENLLIVMALPTLQNGKVPFEEGSLTNCGQRSNNYL